MRLLSAANDTAVLENYSQQLQCADTISVTLLRVADGGAHGRLQQYHTNIIHAWFCMYVHLLFAYSLLTRVIGAQFPLQRTRPRQSNDHTLPSVHNEHNIFGVYPTHAARHSPGLRGVIVPCARPSNYFVRHYSRLLAPH